MIRAVEFHNVTRSCGDVHTADGVSIAIDGSELFSMLGPSGSGKTTCLCPIAEFEQLSGDAITIFDKQASELPPRERNANTVFQDYALLPHMSTPGSVTYRLMVRSINKKQRHAKAREALGKVVLGFVHERKPSQLSSGQCQHVAIARTLVNKPRVSLLDEPFEVLDLKLRGQMQLELKKLQQSLGIMFILVTHNQREVLSMSDRVAMFNNGHTEQVDSPRELYIRPCTPFVASFVGTSNVLDVTMPANVCGLQGMFFLCPGHIHLSDAGGEAQITGVIQTAQYQGVVARFELKLVGGEELLVSRASPTGETLSPTLSPDQQVMTSWLRDVMIPLVEER